jgi:hypothetical protein
MAASVADSAELADSTRTVAIHRAVFTSLAARCLAQQGRAVLLNKIGSL